LDALPPAHLSVLVYLIAFLRELLQHPHAPRYATGKKRKKKDFVYLKKDLVYLIAFLRELLQHHQALRHASVKKKRQGLFSSLAL
jgi:hypothetical protein